jgi:hypothetical protein
VECLAHSGEAAGALALAEDVAARVEPDTSQAAMLARLRGYAALQLGRLDEAESWFAGSLSAGRAADAPFEVGLTLRAFAYLVAARGEDPVMHLTEAEAVLAPLGIVAVDEPAMLSVTTSPAPFIPLQADGGQQEPSVPS